MLPSEQVDCELWPGRGTCTQTFVRWVVSGTNTGVWRAFFLMLLLAPCVSLAILLAPETPNPECMQCRREDLLEQKTICAGMMAVVGCRGTGAQECEKPLASSARVAQLLGLTFAPPGRGSCAACFFLWC